LGHPPTIVTQKVYANAAIAEAVIVAGWKLDSAPILRNGLRMLEWLLAGETRNGQLSGSTRGRLAQGAGVNAVTGKRVRHEPARRVRPGRGDQADGQPGFSGRRKTGLTSLPSTSTSGSPSPSTTRSRSRRDNVHPRSLVSERTF
jgi:hypothetical protein